jgi:DNA-binding XRE family transcriptional regulator
MSRELLAGLSDCTLQTVINYETGASDPIGSTVAKMARALDITIDSLYKEGEAA